MRIARALRLIGLVALASGSGCKGPRQWADPGDGSTASGTDGRDVSGNRAELASGGAVVEGGTPTDASSAGEAAPPPPPPAANQRRLTVMLTGPGEILVDEQPLPCPATCVVDRPSGTPVTVATRPGKTAAGPISMFIGWSGACTGKGGCVVTLDDNKTLNASFHRFVAWEEPIVAADRARLRLGLNPLGRDLYVSGEFSGTINIAGRSFTSAGASSDGIVMRYAEDGRAIWSKILSGPGPEYAALVVPGLGPAELRLAAWVWGSAGAFGMQAVAGGALHLFLNRDGDLLRFVATQAESPYSASQEPYDFSPSGNRFIHMDFDGADGSTRLQLIDESGRVLWSKPDETVGRWFAARVCDSAGSVVALRGLGDMVTIAGATFDRSSGDTLLVKVSAQGEYLWATALTVDWTATVPQPSVFCDQAGDVYVTATFKDEFKIGDRSARAMDGDTNVAVAKVRGVTPQALWLTTFGSKYEDSVSAWAVEVAGKVLIAAKFVGDVTIAGETFPESYPAASILIRIDAATGSAMSALRTERDIGTMVTHPSAGAYFAGSTGLGQLVPRP
jgi:hypothetical protein